MHERVRWTLASIFCIATLSAPALWNGFPLLQYDTGGYLARWYEGYLVPSRAVVYGLILNAGSLGNFWPVIAAQAAITVWIVALAMRRTGLGGRPFLLAGIVAVLSVATTLPWLTSILLTDIFCGIGVLALALLLVGQLSLRERAGAAGLVAIAAATHSATLAVLLIQLCFTPLFFRHEWQHMRRGIRDGVVALLLGAMMVFAANFALAGRIAWTPGGFALSFGRMLQDGIVDRYLADHCPDAQLKLCSYRAQLPHDADEFFWGNEVFISLGRFAGLGKEMERIALGSLVEYPTLQLKTALIAAGKQLISVHTGEGVVRTAWHTYAIIEQRTPGASAQMRAARQQREGIDFRHLNWMHWPLALLAAALLVLLASVGRSSFPPVIGKLAATTLVAVLANAVVCGVLSNPHDRYGARLAWVPLLILMLAVISSRRAALPCRERNQRPTEGRARR